MLERINYLTQGKSTYQKRKDRARKIKEVKEQRNCERISDFFKEDDLSEGFDKRIRRVGTEHKEVVGVELSIDNGRPMHLYYKTFLQNFEHDPNYARVRRISIM